MLTLMRHGQASFGHDHYDRLSGLGIEQSRATGRFFRERSQRWSLLQVGPRERHRDTARAIEEACAWGVAWQQDPDLDEFIDNAGSLAGDAPGPAAGTSPAHDARRTAMAQRINAWVAAEAEIEGSPTFADFRQRAGKWVRQQLAQGEESPVQLAVTSGGFIAVAVCEVMGLPDTMFVPVVSQVMNASLTQFGVTRGQIVLSSFNSTAHLPLHLVSRI